MVNWTQETKKALHCATASLSPGTRSLPQEFISFFLINFLNASLNLEGKKKKKKTLKSSCLKSSVTFLLQSVQQESWVTHLTFLSSAKTSLTLCAKSEASISKTEVYKLFENYSGDSV